MVLVERCLGVVIWMVVLYGGGGFGVVKSLEGDCLILFEGFDEDGVGVSLVNMMVLWKFLFGEINF